MGHIIGIINIEMADGAAKMERIFGAINIEILNRDI